MIDSITDIQSKYFGYALTLRAGSGDAEKLTAAVAGAQVDLNPHQVDAALFAFNSPLSRGALLADEVGLGKTIEAGLVLAQHWAERKRRLLVVTPANLRKQWYQELTEKFFLDCVILEARSYNQAIRDRNYAPFEQDNAVVICSYQFVRSKAADVARVPWDLVVIDEAHRLRNVYLPGKVIANTIKDVLAPRKKILLTATPLQNSLLELYGLVSIIDDHMFGDVHSFREQFMSTTRRDSTAALKQRLETVCTRTLRRQVRQYVSYTNRFPIVEEFTPSESEDALYELVTEYLRRPNLQALPTGQRTLMTLVLRKLLASSTFAIAGALINMSARLRASLRAPTELNQLEDDLAEDFESLDETEEEWDDDPESVPRTAEERAAIEAEIKDLESFAELARSISHNAKGDALLKALRVAMDKAAALGAERKAIIFTESRKTQDYLQRILADTEWADGIALFNGSNADPRSREIYAAWLKRNERTERVTGSRTADMRSALVDEFRDRGKIMIATEAAAEGINLQFCSLVVNYDLPWNPQRIEQRIGRCHRYGQKHDVVVVNFLNRTNEADQRVFELLSEKFKLFEGVFGASDEVLGAIESGIDIERKIAGIYQNCRTVEEIDGAFRQLRLELTTEIDEQMAATRQKLLENFDDEVRDKLKARHDESRASLDRFERMLMRLTRHELDGRATFANESSFTLENLLPGIDAPPGLYELPRRSDHAHIYRVTHPLAEAVIERARSRECGPASVTFDLTGYQGRIAALDPFIGQSGELIASLLTVEALDQTEERILLAALTDDGIELDDELIRRMLELPATATPLAGWTASDQVMTALERASRKAVQEIGERNLAYFQAETDKLDNWADDLKVGLEREIKDLDRQIREARKTAKAALTLEEKLAGQRAIKTLESQRIQKRRSLFDAQDQIDIERGALIDRLEKSLGRLG